MKAMQKNLLRPLIVLCIAISALEISVAGNSISDTSDERNIKPKLSETAQQGKVLFTACSACHNSDLTPAVAPPMFAIQKRYKRAYSKQQEFVERLVSFVQKPTENKAMMKRAVQKKGLMPKGIVNLTEDELLKVATYIYEEKFKYPCEHWRNAVNDAEKSSKGPDSHIEKDIKMLKRFCS